MLNRFRALCAGTASQRYSLRAQRRASRARLRLALTLFAIGWLAAALLEGFNSRNIVLFDDDDLIADLKQLRVVERNYGYRLESPRSSRGHGDRATAFALALLAAKRFATPAFAITDADFSFGGAEFPIAGGRF